MTLTVLAWCVDAGIAKEVEFDLLEQVLKRFRDEGIEIPIPCQTVVLKNTLSSE